METANVNEAYMEILKCHEVSDDRNKSYILHVSEVFIFYLLLKLKCINYLNSHLFNLSN